MIWSAATCRRFSSIAFLSAITEIESGDKSPHSKITTPTRELVALSKSAFEGLVSAAHLLQDDGELWFHPDVAQQGVG
jgi:hypothetical protein